MSNFVSKKIPKQNKINTNTKQVRKLKTRTELLCYRFVFPIPHPIRVTPLWVSGLQENGEEYRKLSHYLGMTVLGNSKKSQTVILTSA